MKTTSRDKIQSAVGISDPTRKWLVALGMIQDIFDYCRQSRDEIREQGYVVKDHDGELLEAITALQGVIYKYLNERINQSILGYGDDNICETSRI